MYIFYYSDILADPNIKKPKAPVMFLKPSSSYITEGQDIVVSIVWVQEKLSLNNQREPF